MTKQERNRQRDRERKREIRMLKREGLWTGPQVAMSTRNTRKLGKNHDRSRPFNCEHCGDQWFQRYGEDSRFCCQTCASDFERAKWAACADCLGRIGLGAQKTAEVLHIVSKTSVMRHRQETNRQAYQSGCGSKTLWHRTRKKLARGLVRKRKLWKQYERAWLDECQPKDVDWACLWDAEKSRRASNEYYRSLDQEERITRNKRAYAAKVEKFGRNALTAKTKKWRDDNREWYKKQQRAWIKRNKHRLAKYRKNQTKKPAFKAKDNLRKRFKGLMRSAKNGGSCRFNGLLGCTTEQLAQHLESKFTKRMTWDNYGTYWHVDHIIPCAAFDHTDPEQVAQCWHWTNLRPLEAKRNIEKSDTIEDGQMRLLLSA